MTMILIAVLLLAGGTSVVLSQSTATNCSAAITCPAAPVTIPSPWYNLNFAQNPTTITGATTTTFGWEASEAGDALCPYTHTGVAIFNSTAGNYIDLNQARGSNSSGYAIPGIIGGAVGTAASVAAGTAGWSFELTFRPNTNLAFSKAYSLGVGPYNGDIYLGTEGTATNIGLGMLDALTTTGTSGHSADFTLLAPYVPNTWYHIVFIQQQVVTANITHGAWWMYLNGVLQTIPGETANNLLPPAVARPAAYLAKSNWAADAAWGGLIDTFRIYQSALTQSQVQTLYAGEMAGCTYTTGTATPAQVYPNLLPRTTPTATPQPIFALNFTTNPLTTVAGASGYTWAASLATDPANVQQVRSGLLILSGGASSCTNCNFVNLSVATGANSVGAVLPPIGGGVTGWSFEAMVQPTNGGADTWPKLYDLGSVRGSNGFCSNDIVLGWSGAAVAPDSFWQLDVCDNTTAAYQYSTIDAMGEIFDNVWYHMVVTISPPTANGQANYFTYLNGQLYTTVTNGFYPALAARPWSYLGKSNWADPYFSGAIDFFNVYQSQLSDVQVANLYAAAATPPNNGSTAGTNNAPTVCGPAITCPAAPVTIPSPWYNLNFAQNPTTITGATTTTFGWEASEAGDALCPYTHTGVAIFNSTAGNYIDLNQARGSNSSGYAIPGIIGGAVGTAASVAAGTAGWSFELTFRPNTNLAFSKAYSLGVGPYNGDIYLGTEGTATNIGLGMLDALTTTGTSGHSADFTLLAPYVPNTWYHIVFIQQQVVTANITHGAWWMYLNGVLQTIPGETANNLLPPAVARPAAYLAKSNWAADAAWGGLIDTFRIYQSALTQSQVQTLYAGEMAGCTYTTGTATPAQVYPNLLPRTTPTATPQPIFALNFTTNPLTTVAGASGYTWAASLATDPANVQQVRSGLLILSGGASSCTNCNFVNLSVATGANSVGAVLPPIGGGVTGWSFEAMVQPTNGGADTWPKLYDLGSVRGSNGFCSNDIVLGWSGAAVAPDSFWQLDVCDNTTAAYQYSTIDAMGEIFDNVWYHMVVTISPPTANGQANYFTYLNGQLYTTVTNGFYPALAARPWSYLGKSNWADPYFSGAIDFFNVYQSQLSDVQVANLYAAAATPPNNGSTAGTNNAPTVCGPAITCPAAPVTIPSPWYNLNFAQNPTTITGATTTTFGWEASEAGDALCPYTHTGVAIFNSTAGNYIDLNQARGSNSSGYAIPGIIGGAVGTAASVAAGTAGWSFELTFRPNTNLAFSKAYSLGVGPYNGDIYLGTEGTATNIGLGMLDALTTTGTSGHSADFTLLAPYVPNTWYHIVFIQQQVVTANITHGAWWMYLNGVLQTIPGETANNLLPPAVARPAAYLAKSNWAADAAWGGLIDTFRIYQSALTQSQVQTLYAGEMAGCTYTTGTATPAQVYPNLLPRTTPTATPQPIFALNFTTNPLTTVAGASGYTWAASLATDPANVQQVRSGLLILSGGASSCTNCNFVNLSVATGANSVGAVLPPIGGGVTGWSFEAMVQPTNGGADTWPKLYDLGSVRGSNGFCSNDIVLGWSGAAVAPDSFWQLDVCDNTTAAYQYSTIDAMGEIFDNVWYHMVVTISPPTANGQANYFTYLNGQLYTTVTNGFYPALAARPWSYLGKSNWADPYFSGAIDFFNVYQSQLSDVQVANLYAAAQSPTGAPSAAPAPSSSSSSSSSSSGLRTASFVTSSPSSSSSSSSVNIALPLRSSSSSSSSSAAVPPNFVTSSSSSSSSNAGVASGGGNSSNSSGGSGLSGGAIAGIVIGSVVGAGLILCVLFAICFRGGRQTKKAPSGGRNSSNGADNRAHEQLGESSVVGDDSNYASEEHTTGEGEEIELH